MTYPPPPDDDPERVPPPPPFSDNPHGNYPPPGEYPPPGQQHYGDPYGQPLTGEFYGRQPEYGFPPPMNAVGVEGAPTLSIRAALDYGWEKYKANAGAWIVVMLIAVVAAAAVQIAFAFATSTSASIVSSVVSFVIGVVFQAAFARGALDELDGQRPAIGAFFRFTNLGVVILVAISVGVITTIGFILLVIPGIVATFLTWYSLTFAIDRGLGVVDAIKSSVRLTTSHVGQLILLALAVIGINIIGALLCLIGLLITAPVTLIATTYAYRTLTNGPISPATR